MAEQLESLARIGVLVFVVGSMAALGLGLTLDRVIAPLKNARNVATSLVFNFILAPAIALGIAWALSLSAPLSTGLLLLATAAGAPFLPKLVEMAGGSVADSIGFMILLMVATILYLPLVLPRILTGVEIGPLDIAQPLVVMMLFPLAVGLTTNRLRPQMALKVQKPLSVMANISLVVVLVLVVSLNLDNIVGLIGSRGLLAAAALTMALAAIGFFVPGQSTETAVTLALGTAQRNVSAALVVAGQNFEVEVVTYVLVASLVTLLLLIGLSRYLHIAGRI